MFRLLTIIVLFGAAYASGTWGLHAHQEHQKELQAPKEIKTPEYKPASVSEILAELPEDGAGVELKDFHYAKEAIGVDLNGKPGWEEAYIPLFPNDVALSPHNLVCVIYQTDQLKNSDDAKVFFENKTLRGFYVAGRQKLSKVAFGKLAKRYGSINYDAAILITAKLPKEEEGLEPHWFALAAFAGFFLLAGWQSFSLIGDVRRRIFRGKSGTSSAETIFERAQNSNEPPKYKPPQ